AVDSDDANAQLAYALDRSELMTARADEQNRLHGARLYLGRRPDRPDPLDVLDRSDGVDAAVDELQEGVDIELEPERHGERQAVGDDVDERDHRLEIDVVAEDTLALHRRKERFTTF